MPLVAGTRMGPYEILAAIGSGGMGEVYRARDIRLGREVAIKMLRRDGHARLLQEARAVSALNHPNILGLFDMCSENGSEFLVMELVRGKTLDQLIGNRGIGVNEAVKYAIPIADALARAHAAGVLHRDLKPSNIMISADGVPKILDFGLAQAAEYSIDGDETRSLSGASERLVAGTAAFMSPEQAEGKKLDARSDIFSFGAVLYEMITGRRAFRGDSTASTLAAVLHRDPDPPSRITPQIPRDLERIIQRCLRKDPNRRFQAMSDVRVELEEVREEPESGMRPAQPSQRERRPSLWMYTAFAAIALLLAAIAVLLARGHFGGSQEQVVEPIRSSIPPPANWSFEHSSFAISPDGTRLAFVAVGPDGTDKLWVRTFSASNAEQINGTDGALLPFWSPDGRRIGFFAGGKLNAVDLSSGAVRILCEAPFARGGGAWSSKGTIVFAPFVSGPLYRISDSGGGPVPVTRITRPGTEQRHIWPFFLPDGTHFFYSDSSGAASGAGESIYVGSLGGGAPKLIASKISENVAYASGYLVYGRDHNLWAQPFDLGRLELNGTATSITSQEVDEERSFSHAEFSISQNGILVFQSLADSAARLAWFDASGKELGQIAESGYMDPQLSPDGRLLAVSSDDAQNGKFFIRVYDLAHGISTRLTDGGTDFCPGWSSDGKTITYSTSDSEFHYLESVPADASSPPQILVKGGPMRLLAWSPGGKLVFSDFSAGPPMLKVYSKADRRIVPFTPGAEVRFSPDGKWIAYVGPLTIPDADAIFVAPFPGPGERIRISSESGAQPNWSHDGRHIFYIAPDRKLMAVDFDPRKKSASAPRLLFQTRIIAPNFSGIQYSVSPDGRFLINSFPSNYSSPLTLISGWTAQLESQGK